VKYLSDLKKIRVQHVDRDAKGVEIKTDVDVITDADCITMDDGDLRSGVKKMIDDRIGEVIDGAPEELDTLKEIATELGKNQSGVSTIIKAINDKLEAKDLDGYAKTSDVDTKLEDKVNVVNGKGLSTNDFTDVDKQKLDAIEDGAEKNKVTSVNGMTGAVTIEVGSGTVDLSEYVKKTDLKAGTYYKTMTAVIDQANSNPLTCVTYEDDARLMEKGSKAWDDFFGAKLVLFKDGKEVRDLKDSELSSLTEADGDVMVKFKRMGLRINTVGDKVYVSMTDNPNSPDFKYYAHSRGDAARDAFYLGAYLGYDQDGKLRSVTGKKPIENSHITNYRTLAQANGEGYDLCGFYQLTFLQAAYVLKYGNLDSQTALGQGLVSGGQSATNTTGATNGKGVDFGSANSSEQMRFQYIEDFWGNRFWAIDGVATDGSCTIFTATDNFNNNRNGYLNSGIKGPGGGGYLKKVFGTSELGFLGKEFGGSASTYYADYSNTRSNYFLFFGGDAGGGSSAGAFRCTLYYGATEADWRLGARLMFI
jgi:hypothetical protein